MKIRRYLTKLSLAASIFLIAACQPAPEERLARAQSYFDNGQFPSAIIELKNALRDSPEMVEARILLARSSFLIADFKTSESEYRRLLANGDIDQEIWIGLGRSLLMQEKPQEVLEYVVPNLLSEKGVSSQESLVLEGDVFLMLGNSSDAEEAYRKSIQVEENVGALIGLAAVHLSQNQNNDAEDILAKAVDSFPKSAAAWRAYANFLRIGRQYRESLESYEKAIQYEDTQTPLSDKFATRAGKVTALLESNEFESAGVQISELAASFPNQPLVSYFRGRHEFGIGNYERAQSELQRYLAVAPNDVRGYAALGIVNFSQNHLRQAEMYLMQAARNSVAGVEINRLLAETQLRLHKPGDALASLEGARLTDTADPSLLALYGRAEVGLGDLQSATEYFEKSVAADPDNPGLSLALAATYLQSDRASDAIKLLENIKVTPNTEYRREALLVGAYLRNDDTSEAVTRATAYLEVNHRDPAVNVLVGALYNSIGDTAKAETYFRHALDFDANSVSAMYNLASIAFESGNFQLADQRLHSLLDRHPAYMPGLMMFAALMQDMGKLDEVQPRLLAAIERSPDSIAAWIMLIRIKHAGSDLDGAQETINQARARFEDHAALDNLEGKILIANGATEMALRKFEQAARKQPGNAAFQYDLASAKFRQGELAGARGAITKYRNIQPSDIRGLALQTRIEISANRTGQARQYVDEYVAGNSPDAVTEMLYGDIALSEKDLLSAQTYFANSAAQEMSWDIVGRLVRVNELLGNSESINLIRNWIANNDGHVGARHLLGQLYETHGRMPEAVSTYEDLYAEGELNATGMNNLAWQYFVSGQDKALELAEKAHELAPGNGSVSDTLGWILFKTGETDRAGELLRQAIVQSSDDPDIKFHLASYLAATGNSDDAKELLAEILGTEKEFSSRRDAEDLVKSL